LPKELNCDHASSSLEIGSSPGACLETLEVDESGFVSFEALEATAVVALESDTAVALSDDAFAVSPTVFEVVLVNILRFGIGMTISLSLHLQLRLELSVLYNRR
jgi:hypothetical protein